MSSFALRPAAVLLAALTFFAGEAALGNPRIVDLNPTVVPVETFLTSTGVVLGGVYLFAAADGAHGAELWSSDGTEAGTQLLADLDPGPTSSSPRDFVLGSGVAFFVADSHEHGHEVWVTDGTAVGTQILVDLAPGSAPSYPAWLTWTGTDLYFTATTRETGEELRRWDGAAVSTLEVVVGPEGSEVGELVADPAGGVLFSAYEAGTGRELYRSDGSPGGTGRLADLLSGPGSSSPTSLEALGSRVAFVATFDGIGREVGLWDSAVGSLETHDIRLGESGSNPAHLLAVGSTRLSLQADDGTTGRELWRYRESTAVMDRLTDLRPGVLDGLTLQEMVALDGKVYFVGEEATVGRELWTYGPVTGLTLVRDLYPGAVGANPRSLRRFDDVLVFGAYLDDAGDELAISDGTEAGTSMLCDIEPGAEGSSPEPLARIGDLLLTKAARTGGRSAVFGAASLAGAWNDLSQGVVHSASDPELFSGDSDGRFAFSARAEELGEELWVADALGVGLLHDLAPGTNSLDARDLLWHGGRLFATIGPSSIVSSEPLVWDGVTIDQLNLNQAGDAEPRGLVPVGDLVLTDAENSSGQRVLWALDGANLSAQELTSESPFAEVASCGDTAFFLLDGDLWTTDGSLASTQLVATSPDGSFYDLLTLCDTDGAPWRVLLVFDSDVDGFDLWASDGTPSGTEVLATGFDSTRGLVFEPPFVQIAAFATAPTQRVLLSIWKPDETTHRNLLVSDGTAPGTQQITGREQPGGGFDAEALFLVASLPGGWLYQDTHDDTGAELWFTDGSVAGTELLEVVPGPVSSRPAAPYNSKPYRGAQVGGRAIVSLFTPDSGFELWSTDGTLAGTLPLDEIWPGAAGEALDLFASGDRVLAAGSGPNGEGRELVVWDQPLFTASFESGDLSAWSGHSR